MSGQKVSYVQITDHEYRRFMESAREVENIENRVQRQLNRQEHQLRSDFNNQMNQIKQKTQQQESYINRLDNKLDTLIESIEAKESNKKNQALAWLQEAQDALVAIGSYRHDKFCPDEYAKLQQKFQLSQINIDNEVFEASISSSQTLWQEACALKNKLEQLENDWSDYFTQAITSNELLIATCDAQKTLELAFDTEDGSETLQVDIDYWCDGLLSNLKDSAINQQNLLKQSEEMEVKDFQQLIAESTELQKEAKELTQKAKEAIILSQSRSDMASDIVESLSSSGFNLVDSCFQGDDQRDAIHLKMQNIAGDEVVTIITPMQNRENKLDIHFFDKESDEHFKQTRLKSMMKRLNESGVDCKAPECASGTKHNSSGDESVRNFEKLKTMVRVK